MVEMSYQASKNRAKCITGYDQAKELMLGIEAIHSRNTGVEGIRQSDLKI